MTIKLARYAITNVLGTKVQILRRQDGEGKYVKGVYQEAGFSDPIKALASVQQPRKTQLERLPEGQRFIEVKLFVCNKEVRGGSEDGSRKGDRIIYLGKTYDTIAISSHAENDFFKVIGVIRAQ